MGVWGRAYLRHLRAYARAFWDWLRHFPPAAWHLLSHLVRTERRRLLVIVLATAVTSLVLAWLGTGGSEIWAIVVTLALGTLVVAVSQEHRTVGTVVVAVMGLCLVGTLAGPRWHPRPLDTATVLPTTTDTSIGGAVATVAVGTYQVSTQDVMIQLDDGAQAPARLRLPVGASEPLPGVVFMHGAGTHNIEHGFAEQAEALASAGAATLVPTKPERGYSLTERDYLSMAAGYAHSITYLRTVPGVDAKRVGIYAESEGAFPGVVATAQDPQVAFLVLASAPVVRLRQQAALAADSYLRRVGAPEQLMTIIPRVLGARSLPGGAFGYVDFDATEYEQHIKVPVLMLYGTNDDSMPLVQGPYTIWQGLQANGNHKLTVRYYEAANHGLKLGTKTDGPLAPGVARDLSRWVVGLPATASAVPHVAGAQPRQRYWAQTPSPTRWYASGDLMLGSLLAGTGLLVAAALGWLLGQAPRLGGRPGLHLPDPIGRMTVAAGLSVLATWMLYLAYLAGIIHLATSHSTDPLLSYGGLLVAQVAGLGTVIIIVRLSQEVWRRRKDLRAGLAGKRWYTPAAFLVLAAARLGSLILLVDLAYWGLFPLLA
ncbi:alpha/beta hydrolase [Actinomyces trachealis]|uniref:alpha/beta hydrolase n=1 Tax=Actinomyces trachealis TaxID=2763540 RepID=UPI001FD54597|nr:acyl-CoA thioester hydrolase/BAAT C-terminal domain-containing protein [Actinomyces trachealis]